MGFLKKMLTPGRCIELEAEYRLNEHVYFVVDTFSQAERAEYGNVYALIDSETGDALAIHDDGRILRWDGRQHEYAATEWTVNDLTML